MTNSVERCSSPSSVRLGEARRDRINELRVPWGASDPGDRCARRDGCVVLQRDDASVSRVRARDQDLALKPAMHSAQMQDLALACVRPRDPPQRI
jgi:hypothetical protein